MLRCHAAWSRKTESAIINVAFVSCWVSGPKWKVSVQYIPK